MNNPRLSQLSRKVLNAICLFGGTQVLTILCSVIRVKLVAIWIGAAGVGLFGIYNAALTLIAQIFMLGMRSSSVKEIASSSDTPSHQALVIKSVIRWSWLLGVAGGIATMLAAPKLSLWSFGDTAHTVGFRTLSAAVVLTCVTGAQLAIMQGRGKLRRLAKASMWGAVAGLIVSVPMFYFWRIDSVVPSFIAYAAAATIAAVIFREPRHELPSVNAGWKETFLTGRNFIVLGTFITLSEVLNQLSGYIFISWLNNEAGAETTGYFQSGYTIINRYAGLIFTAIGMELYPRLATVAGSPMRTATFVSHEIRIILLLVIPIVAVMIVAAPLIVTLLYSSEFSSIVPYIETAAPGTVFRAVSWIMAYVILARGDGIIYMVTELSSAALAVGLQILGYSIGGLTGLGIAYTIWYICYTIIIAIVYFRRYRLRLGRQIPHLIAWGVIATTAVLLTIVIAGQTYATIAACLLVAWSVRRMMPRNKTEQPASR